MRARSYKIRDESTKLAGILRGMCYCIENICCLLDLPSSNQEMVNALLKNLI